MFFQEEFFCKIIKFEIEKCRIFFHNVFDALNSNVTELSLYTRQHGTVQSLISHLIQVAAVFKVDCEVDEVVGRDPS